MVWQRIRQLPFFTMVWRQNLGARGGVRYNCSLYIIDHRSINVVGGLWCLKSCWEWGNCDIPAACILLNTDQSLLLEIKLVYGCVRGGGKVIHLHLYIIKHRSVTIVAELRCLWSCCWETINDSTEKNTQNILLVTQLIFIRMHHMCLEDYINFIGCCFYSSVKQSLTMTPMPRSQTQPWIKHIPLRPRMIRRISLSTTAEAAAGRWMSFPQRSSSPDANPRQLQNQILKTPSFLPHLWRLIATGDILAQMSRSKGSSSSKLIVSYIISIIITRDS